MEPIVTASLIGGGTSLLGGLLGGSNKGAKRLAAAIRDATKFQRQVYQTGREDLSPYRNITSGPTQDYVSGVGEDSPLAFLRQAAGAESPLYETRKQDYLDDINRQLAYRGLYFSPRAMQEVTSRGLNRLGAEEAEARWGRNLTLADIGLDASKFTGGQIGQAAASNMTNLAGLYSSPAFDQSSMWPSALAGVNQAAQGYLSNRAYQNYYNQFLDRTPTNGGGNNFLSLSPGMRNYMPSLGNYSVTAPTLRWR